ncbi:hypothetical protein CSUI_001746 [Cystoisospora suis]|uniref:Uncharacterized protein n=1 Tax=Cystoisospora suis TaxID=483139 RepID=A0A2C6L9A5_9APIC|nr:hypothetical protein CSUI_001746 [Cystoisospora suis]
MELAKEAMVRSPEAACTQRVGGSCSVPSTPTGDRPSPSSEHGAIDPDPHDEDQVLNNPSGPCYQDEVASSDTNKLKTISQQGVFDRVMPCGKEDSQSKQTAATEEYISSVDSGGESEPQGKEVDNNETAAEVGGEGERRERGIAGQEGGNEAENHAWDEADSEAEEDDRVFVLKLSPSPSPRSPDLSALSPTATQTHLVTPVGERERVEVLSPLSSSHTSSLAVPSFSLVLRGNTSQEGTSSRQVSTNSARSEECQAQLSLSGEDCRVPSGAISAETKYACDTEQQFFGAPPGETAAVPEPVSTISRKEHSASPSPVETLISHDRLPNLVETGRFRSRAVIEETHQSKELGAVDEPSPETGRGRKRHCAFQRGGRSHEQHDIPSISFSQAGFEGHKERVLTSRPAKEERTEVHVKEDPHVTATHEYDNRHRGDSGGQAEQQKQKLSSVYPERNDHTSDAHQASRVVYRGMHNPMIGQNCFQVKDLSAKEPVLPTSCPWSREVEDEGLDGGRKQQQQQALTRGLLHDNVQSGQEGPMPEGHSGVPQQSSLESSSAGALPANRRDDLCFRNSRQEDTLQRQLWEQQGNSPQETTRHNQRPAAMFFGDSRAAPPEGPMLVTPQPVFLGPGSPSDASRVNGGGRQVMPSPMFSPQVIPHPAVMMSGRRGSGSSLLTGKPDELLPSGVRYDAHKKAYRAIVRTSSGTIKNRSFSCNKYGANHARFLALEAVRRSSHVTPSFSPGTCQAACTNPYGSSGSSPGTSGDSQRDGNQCRQEVLLQTGFPTDAYYLYGSGYRHPGSELSHYSFDNSGTGCLQIRFDRGEFRMTPPPLPLPHSGPPANHAGHKHSGPCIPACYASSSDVHRVWIGNPWHQAERTPLPCDLSACRSTAMSAEGSSKLSRAFPSEPHVPQAQSAEGGGNAGTTAVCWAGCAEALCMPPWQSHPTEPAAPGSIYAPQNAERAEPGHSPAQSHLVWAVSRDRYEGEHRSSFARPGHEDAAEHSESPAKAQDVGTVGVGARGYSGFQGEAEEARRSHVHDNHPNAVDRSTSVAKSSGDVEAKGQACTSSTTDRGDGDPDIGVYVGAGAETKEGSESEGTENPVGVGDSASAVHGSRLVDRGDFLENNLTVESGAPADGFSGSRPEGESCVSVGRVSNVSSFDGSLVPWSSRGCTSLLLNEDESGIAPGSCLQRLVTLRGKVHEEAVDRTAVVEQNITDNHGVQQNNNALSVRYGIPRRLSPSQGSGSCGAWTHVDRGVNHQPTVSVSHHDFAVSNIRRSASSSPRFLFSSQIPSSTQNTLCFHLPFTQSPLWPKPCSRPSPDARGQVVCPPNQLAGAGTASDARETVVVSMSGECSKTNVTSSDTGSVSACHRKIYSERQENNDEEVHGLSLGGQEGTNLDSCLQACKESQNSQNRSRQIHIHEAVALGQSEGADVSSSRRNDSKETYKFSSCRGDCSRNSDSAQCDDGGLFPPSARGGPSVGGKGEASFSSGSLSEEDGQVGASGCTTVGTACTLCSQAFSSLSSSVRGTGSESKAGQLSVVLTAPTGTGAIAGIEDAAGEGPGSLIKRGTTTGCVDTLGTLTIGVHDYLRRQQLLGETDSAREASFPETTPTGKPWSGSTQGPWTYEALVEGGGEDENCVTIGRVCGRVMESPRRGSDNGDTVLECQMQHDDDDGSGVAASFTLCEAGSGLLMQGPVEDQPGDCSALNLERVERSEHPSEGGEASPSSGGIYREHTGVVSLHSSSSAYTRAYSVRASTYGDLQPSSQLCDSPTAPTGERGLGSPLLEDEVDGFLSQLAWGVSLLGAKMLQRDAHHSGKNSSLRAVHEHLEGNVHKDKGVTEAQMGGVRGAKAMWLSEVTEREREVRVAEDERGNTRVSIFGSDRDRKDRSAVSESFLRGENKMDDREVPRGDEEQTQEEPLEKSLLSSSISLNCDVLLNERGAHDDWPLQRQHSSRSLIASQAGHTAFSSASPRGRRKQTQDGHEDADVASRTSCLSLLSGCCSSGVVADSASQVRPTQDSSAEVSGSLCSGVHNDSHSGGPSKPLKLIEHGDDVYQGEGIEKDCFHFSRLHRGSVGSIATITSLSDRCEELLEGVIEKEGTNETGEGTLLKKKYPQCSTQLQEEEEETPEDNGPGSSVLTAEQNEPKDERQEELLRKRQMDLHQEGRVKTKRAAAGLGEVKLGDVGRSLEGENKDKRQREDKGPEHSTSVEEAIPKANNLKRVLRVAESENPLWRSGDKEGMRRWQQALSPPSVMEPPPCLLCKAIRVVLDTLGWKAPTRRSSSFSITAHRISRERQEASSQSEGCSRPTEPNVGAASTTLTLDKNTSRETTGHYSSGLFTEDTQARGTGAETAASLEEDQRHLGVNNTSSSSETDGIAPASHPSFSEPKRKWKEAISAATKSGPEVFSVTQGPSAPQLRPPTSLERSGSLVDVSSKAAFLLQGSEIRGARVGACSQQTGTALVTLVGQLMNMLESNGGIPPCISGLQFSLQDFAWFTRGGEISSCDVLDLADVLAHCGLGEFTEDEQKEMKMTKKEVRTTPEAQQEMVACIIEDKSMENEASKNKTREEKEIEEKERGQSTEVILDGQQDRRSLLADRPVWCEREELCQGNPGDETGKSTAAQKENKSSSLKLPDTVNSIDEKNEGEARQLESTSDCRQAVFPVSSTEDYLHAWLSAAAHHVFRQIKRRLTGSEISPTLGVSSLPQPRHFRHVPRISPTEVSTKVCVGEYQAGQADLLPREDRSHCLRKITPCSSSLFPRYITKYRTSALRSQWIARLHVMQAQWRWKRGVARTGKTFKRSKVGRKRNDRGYSKGGRELAISQGYLVTGEEGSDSKSGITDQSDAAKEAELAVLKSTEKSKKPLRNRLKFISTRFVPPSPLLSSSFLKPLLPRPPLQIEYRALALHASAIASRGHRGDEDLENTGRRDQPVETGGERRDQSGQRSRRDQQEHGREQGEEKNDQKNEGKDGDAKAADRSGDHRSDERVEEQKAESQQAVSMEGPPSRGRAESGLTCSQSAQDRGARYLARQERQRLLERDREAKQNRLANQGDGQGVEKKKSAVPRPRERKRDRRRDTKNRSRPQEVLPQYGEKTAPEETNEGETARGGRMEEAQKGENEETVKKNKPQIKIEEEEQETKEGVSGQKVADAETCGRSKTKARRGGIKPGKKAETGGEEVKGENRVKGQVSQDRDSITDCGTAGYQGADKTSGSPCENGGVEIKVAQEPHSQKVASSETSKRRQPHRQAKKQSAVGQEGAQNILERTKKEGLTRMNETEKISAVPRPGEGDATEGKVKPSVDENEKVAKLEESGMVEGRMIEQAGVRHTSDQNRELKDNETKQQGDGDSEGGKRERNGEIEGGLGGKSGSKKKREEGVHQHSSPARVPRCASVRRRDVSSAHTGGKSRRRCTSQRSAYPSSDSSTLEQVGGIMESRKRESDILGEAKTDDRLKRRPEQPQQERGMKEQQGASVSVEGEKGEKAASEEAGALHDKKEVAEGAQGLPTSPANLPGTRRAEATSDESSHMDRDTNSEQDKAVPADQAGEKASDALEAERRGHPCQESEGDFTKAVYIGTPPSSVPPCDLVGSSNCTAGETPLVVSRGPGSFSLSLAHTLSPNPVEGTSQDSLVKDKEQEWQRRSVEKVVPACAEGTVSHTSLLQGVYTVPQVRAEWRSKALSGPSDSAASGNRCYVSSAHLCETVTNAVERANGIQSQETLGRQASDRSASPSVGFPSSSSSMEVPPSSSGCEWVFPPPVNLLSPAPRSTSPSLSPGSFLLASSIRSPCPSAPSGADKAASASSCVSTPGFIRGNRYTLSRTPLSSTYFSSSVSFASLATMPSLPTSSQVQDPGVTDRSVVSWSTGVVADRRLAFPPTPEEGSLPPPVSSDTCLSTRQFHEPAAQCSRAVRSAERQKESSLCQAESQAQARELFTSGVNVRDANCGEQASDSGALPAGTTDQRRSLETKSIGDGSTSAERSGRQKENDSVSSFSSSSSLETRAPFDSPGTFSSCLSSSSVDSFRPVRLLSGNPAVSKVTSCYPSVDLPFLVERRGILSEPDRVSPPPQDVRSARALEVEAQTLIETSASTPEGSTEGRSTALQRRYVTRRAFLSLGEHVSSSNPMSFIPLSPPPGTSFSLEPEVDSEKNEDPQPHEERAKRLKRGEFGAFWRKDTFMDV